MKTDKTFHFRTSVRQIMGDLHTPVGIYLRLRDLYPQSALMECSDYHDPSTARSFVATKPVAQVAVSHGTVVETFPDGSTRSTPLDMEQKGRAKEQLAECVAHFLAAMEVEGECSDFYGAYGYTSFNAVRYTENIDVRDETMERNDAPDLLYILYSDLVVVDHHSNTLTLLSLEGAQGVERLERALQRQDVQPFPFRAVGDTRSTLTDEEHRANVRQSVQHCLRGDVFQIVVSRRFVQAYEGDDFRLYRALRSVNPSPYLFYFDFGGFRIFGSSPETHCRIVGERAYIDPIAGTTPRTGDAAQDKQNAEYLRQDPKENAEHVMLVDLARNDLSSACDDVKVDFYKDMQWYSHVIHLVSRVSGRLTEQGNDRQSRLLTRMRAFLNTFPAGTLSGAPKVRAMQLISQMEPHCRGVYGGCIGVLGLNGDLNQAIVIRTFVARNNELWFQAGCGVVAKSDDGYELREVNHKLGALRRAMQRAEKDG